MVKQEGGFQYPDELMKAGTEAYKKSSDAGKAREEARRDYQAEQGKGIEQKAVLSGMAAMNPEEQAKKLAEIQANLAAQFDAEDSAAEAEMAAEMAKQFSEKRDQALESGDLDRAQRFENARAKSAGEAPETLTLPGEERKAA